MPKFIGPLKITKVISDTAYKLTLPTTIKIHDVFHVSLLRPYRTDGRAQPPSPILSAGEEWFLVDSLVSHRVRRGKREYLVRYTGYGPEHNLWSPEAAVSLLNAFPVYWYSIGLEPPVNPALPKL